MRPRKSAEEIADANSSPRRFRMSYLENRSQKPNVFLVGAGPGSPGLLTLRAAEVLARADLVLYDQLVPERLLDFANRPARRSASAICPASTRTSTRTSTTLLIETATGRARPSCAQGRRPAHLRPRRRGGRGTSRRPGIAYEIVPGVTAALAAGGVPRNPADAPALSPAPIALVTGHELAEQARQPARLEGARRVPRHARHLHGHRPAAGDRGANC